jgi:hypothetical protein
LKSSPTVPSENIIRKSRCAIAASNSLFSRANSLFLCQKFPVSVEQGNSKKVGQGGVHADSKMLSRILSNRQQQAEFRNIILPNNAPRKSGTRNLDASPYHCALYWSKAIVDCREHCGLKTRFELARPSADWEDMPLDRMAGERN